MAQDAQGNHTGRCGRIQQVIEGLARAWEGRIELHLLGPMAAYDFAGTTPPEDDMNLLTLLSAGPTEDNWVIRG
jgi:hypothetical protein